MNGHVLGLTSIQALYSNLYLDIGYCLHVYFTLKCRIILLGGNDEIRECSPYVYMAFPLTSLPHLWSRFLIPDFCHVLVFDDEQKQYIVCQCVIVLTVCHFKSSVNDDS